jgi:energy-coupling factor transport system ATP-binding protein
VAVLSIQVDHLTHIYDPGTPTARLALRDVSLRIEDKSCTAIVGVTGSGKSTLVQHFNGLLRPTQGCVRVGDIAVSGDRARSSDLRQLRRQVGLLFQFPEAQLFAATVYEDVAFGPRQLGLDEATVRSQVLHALDAVALSTSASFLERSPFALSGGQRRRVALAGVLAMRPRILVLDEPSAGLDAEARDELYDRLSELRRTDALTLIFISHDMAEVAALADSVFVMNDGEIQLQGSPEAIFRRPGELIDCGLMPPPLAQVVMLAEARGWEIEAEHFTPQKVAEALAGHLRASGGPGLETDLPSSGKRLGRGGDVC